MRKKIIIILLALTLLFSLVTLCVYTGYRQVPKELIEYNASEKWGADSHSHISAYMPESGGFTAFAYIKTVADIKNKYLADSKDTPMAVYSTSGEASETLASLDDKRSVGVNATLYLGNYFTFHPLKLKEGAYPMADVGAVDSILVDELAAWQLFGTDKGVVGMQMKIGTDIYTVCGVTEVPKGIYTEVYGDKPRVYINADSAAFRKGSNDRSFTVFEAMIPDPITNYAKNLVNELMGSFKAVVYNIDDRFEGESLRELLENKNRLITETNDIKYSYSEKAMLILALKAAEVYSVYRVLAVIPVILLFAAVLLLIKPVLAAFEKIYKKHKF